MLVGALQLENEYASLLFTDKEQIGEWAKKAVAQAVQTGIVGGYEDGRFRPHAYLTRTEMLERLNYL